MKTLNVRLAVILLGVVLAVAVTITLLYSFQKRRNAYVFLRLAQEAQQAAEKAKDKGTGTAKNRIQGGRPELPMVHQSRSR